MAPKDTFFSPNRTLNCHGKLIDLSIPKVMGILNVTPDSFYDGGKHQTIESIQSAIDIIMEEGADFIDVGGYSSRPGASKVTANEEWSRVSMVLKAIHTSYPQTIVSIDTFRSSIAQRAVKEFEADMVNDISAGNLDDKMFETITSLQVPYIMMHMQGNPENMQKKPNYKNLIPEILSFFEKKIQALVNMGVNDIIIDPGFGFGKTLDHNYELLKHLHDFSIFNLPILAGLSRKSMIYKTLGTDSDHALNGTTVLNTIALLQGARILRVHDVKEAKECIKLVNKYASVG